MTDEEYREHMRRQDAANRLMLHLTTSWTAHCTSCTATETVPSNGGMLAAHELLNRGWSAVGLNTYCPSCGLL